MPPHLLRWARRRPPERKLEALLGIHNVCPHLVTGGPSEPTPRGAQSQAPLPLCSRRLPQSMHRPSSRRETPQLCSALKTSKCRQRIEGGGGPL
eukprot:15055431-Alexandrium_andersonii.AAC.1